MRNLFFFLLSIFLSSFSGCKGQTEFGTNLIHLVKTIPLPEVKGRIDHMDVNLKDQILYIAALGNNTLEVLDLQTGKIIQSIKGLSEPQGVCYIPQTKEILVANGGTGDCYFYNSKSFDKISTIHLSDDADDVRYDSAEKKIYIGYGDGGIAIIDADTHKQIGDVKLPAHPESFQIDKSLKLIFVNLPDAKMVGVIDLNQFKLINKWVRNSPTANFPMALDNSKHRVFIGYRHPPKLVILDDKTGKELSMTTMAGDADDIYYDARTGSVFVSGGDGNINIFLPQDVGESKQIASIHSRNGARTSLLIPELNLFVIAARAESGQSASILAYKTDN